MENGEEGDVDKVDEILGQYNSRGVETSFKVAGRTYHVFAFPSPSKDGPLIRWNLYELGDDGSKPMRGLSFGMAKGVREAMEEVVEAAREHASGSSPIRAVRSFRPSPID